MPLGDTRLGNPKCRNTKQMADLIHVTIAFCPLKAWVSDVPLPVNGNRSILCIMCVMTISLMSAGRLSFCLIGVTLVKRV